MSKNELHRQLNDRTAKLLRFREVLETREFSAAERAEVNQIKQEIEDIKAKLSGMADAQLVEEADEVVRSFNSTLRPRKAPTFDHTKSYGNGFSITRAIRSMVSDGTLSSEERSVSDRIARVQGTPAQHGFYVPFSTRALNTTTGAGGVATVTRSDDLIDALRAASIADKLGVRVFEGLRGIQKFPRLSATSTAYWVAEGSEATASNPTMDGVTLTPKTLMGAVTYTRKFLFESTFDVESIIRDDLVKVLGSEIDRAILNGSGSGAEPEGILQMSGLPLVALGTNGGAMTWDSVVQLEEGILNADALIDPSKVRYVTSPKGLRQAKTVSKAGTFPVFIYDDGKLNGYEVVTTTHIPGDLTKGTGTNLTALLMGDFSQAYLGYFGDGMMVTIDPYSRASFNEVRVIAAVDLDFQVAHIESFGAIVDISS